MCAAMLLWCHLCLCGWSRAWWIFLDFYVFQLQWNAALLSPYWYSSYESMHEPWGLCCESSRQRHEPSSRSCVSWALSQPEAFVYTTTRLLFWNILCTLFFFFVAVSAVFFFHLQLVLSVTHTPLSNVFNSRLLKMDTAAQNSNNIW